MKRQSFIFLFSAFIVRMENVMGAAVLSGHVIKLTGCDVSGAVTTNCRRLRCSCCCYFFENTTYCIANFCNVSEKNSANRAHIHRLPRNRVLRRRWLEKCGRPAGVDDQARVCSLHFTADDYENLRQYDEGISLRRNGSKCFYDWVYNMVEKLLR